MSASQAIQIYRIKSQNRSICSARRIGCSNYTSLLVHRKWASGPRDYFETSSHGLSWFLYLFPPIQIKLVQYGLATISCKKKGKGMTDKIVASIVIPLMLTVCTYRGSSNTEKKHGNVPSGDQGMHQTCNMRLDLDNMKVSYCSCKQKSILRSIKTSLVHIAS